MNMAMLIMVTDNCDIVVMQMEKIMVKNSNSRV